MLRAKGPLFAVTHDLQLRGRHAKILQVSFGSLGAPFAEHQVIGEGASFIAQSNRGDRNHQFRQGGRDGD